LGSDLAITQPHGYESRARAMQIWWITGVMMFPMTYLASLLVLWFVPLRRGALLACFVFTEVLRSLTSAEVCLILAGVATTNLSHISEFILSRSTLAGSCTALTPSLIQYDALLGLQHDDTCLDIKGYYERGFWMILALAICEMVLGTVLLRSAHTALICHRVLGSLPAPEMSRWTRMKVKIASCAPAALVRQHHG